MAPAWIVAPTTARAEEEMEGGGTQNIHFHGYGELHFNIPAAGSAVPDQSDPAEADLHRMVWGMDVRLTDRISIHTEVDFEHSAQEMELEYAYVDFMVNPWATIRGGSVLMPIGALNEFHEPPLFYSVERPYVQNVLIPTTWQEAAAGLVGEWAGVRYRMYVTSGLDASGFTDSSGIRGGRGKVAESPSSGLAYAGRLEYVGVPGVNVGASAFIQPQANQRDAALNAAGADPGVRLFEGDLRLRKAGFDIQGTVVHTRIKDASDLSAALAPEVIGTLQFGWNAEVAYHLLQALAPDSEQDVVPFIRYERFDTQAKAPDGFTADPVNNRRVITGGISYLPIPQVAIKVDHERWEDGADDHGHRTNLGLAWMFY
ncbi:MAG: hypothetical protein AB1515_07840 [Nitrospirota bacterium]